MKDLTGYLGSELVIKRIIFIISSDDKNETTAIERLVRRRNQFRGLYRLQLEHHATSILPDLASLRSMLEKLFDNIIDDLQKIEQLHPSTESITEEIENVIDGSSLLFDTFKSISAQSSLCDLSKDSLKFLLLQSLIEILIKKSYKPEAFEHMWNLCCQDYNENPAEAMKVEKIAKDYKEEKAIYHYTQCSCVFRLVNRAFRLEDIERIFRFGCYIADMHRQLEQLASNQRINQNQDTKTFYRGARLSTDVVQQFKDSTGHLISLNGLLSTSENYMISTMFCGLSENIDGDQSVIFEININSTTTNLIRPYANIREYSVNPDENEVLFFMGFVWKIESMDKMLLNLWYIVLQPCAEYDSQLIQYIEESRRNCTYLTIGNILRELGDHANADNFYERMLENDNLSDETLVDVYFNMGMLADDRGVYLKALKYFQKAEDLIKTTAIHNSEVLGPSRRLFAHDIVLSRMRIFSNLGRTYLRDGRYGSAQKYFDKALQETGPDIERAAVLNNYGLLEFQRRNKKKAYDYINQAIQLAGNDACSYEYKSNLDFIVKHL